MLALSHAICLNSDGRLLPLPLFPSVSLIIGQPGVSGYLQFSYLNSPIIISFKFLRVDATVILLQTLVQTPVLMEDVMVVLCATPTLVQYVFLCFVIIHFSRIICGKSFRVSHLLVLLNSLCLLVEILIFMMVSRVFPTSVLYVNNGDYASLNC